jgi:hypothetical protein
MPEAVEVITDDAGTTIAIVVRGAASPENTTFVTPEDAPLQVGHVVYGAGGTIRRHRHRPLERRLVGTAEVLLVREGRCAVELYDGAATRVAEREISTGDVIVLLSGGHGFRMHEDTVLLEVKQGPYTGLDEKEWF